MIDRNAFRKFIPHSKYPDQWYDALFSQQTELGGKSLLEEYEITTPNRIAAFLAQCHHESGGFVWLTENLNYSASGLLKVFPKYFSTDAQAKAYAKQPDKIANYVYANRMGNGDEASQEGYKFCGRGLIQLTGRSNYQAFADSLEMNIDDVPEYLATFEGASQSACWYWESQKLNQWADAGDILTLTKRINGGTIGLEDRKKHYDHALHVLGA